MAEHYLGVEVTDFSTERIGTGKIAECHRIKLQYAMGAQKRPATLVLKRPTVQHGCLGASRADTQSSWIMVYSTDLRPDRPTVAVVDFEVPTPGEDLVVHTNMIHATHVSEDLLKRYRVTLNGKGDAVR